MINLATNDKPIEQIDWPTVSIIIPVYNDTERLLQCLQAIEHQTYPREKIEIVVVDNQSNEPVGERLPEIENLRLCEEIKPGSYAARNCGLNEATGEVIAFTDSDCLPDKNWLKEGVSTLVSDPECGAVGGRVALFCKNSFRPKFVEWYDILFHGFDQKQVIEEQQFAATANVITKRSVLKAVGPFDSEFKSGGDAEWGKRLVSSGFDLKYSQTALVRHPARSSFFEVVNKVNRVTGGQFLLAEKGQLEPREKLKNIWQLVKFPLRTAYYLLFKEPQLKTPRDRMGVLMMTVIFRYVEAFEWSRLYLGGRPRRGN